MNRDKMTEEFAEFLYTEISSLMDYFQKRKIEPLMSLIILSEFERWNTEFLFHFNEENKKSGGK